MIQSIRASAVLAFVACVSLAGCSGSGSSSGAQSVSGSITQGSGTPTILPSRSIGTVVDSGYTISGTVQGAAGVSVSLTGSTTSATLTDSSGNFSFTTLGAGSYTVTPARVGYLFVPVSRAALVSSASTTDLTFSATPSAAANYRISGTVSGSVAAGVVITLNGSNIGSTATDSAGNYSFAGLENGTYTLSAALPGYAFTAPLIVSVADADAVMNNFSSANAAAATLTLVANNPLPEATVGSPYSTTVVQSISGGTAPYRYATGDLASGAPPLGMILNPSGNLTGTPSVPGQYAFTVCATDSNGELSACEPTSITVVPAQSGQLPVVSLTASPSTLTSGASSVLTWSSQYAASCAASGGWSGTQPANGSFTVAPTSTTSYTITCTNSYGSGHAAVLVTVQASGSDSGGAPTVNLTATNAQITAGGTSQLQWSSTNASTCVASGGWKGVQHTSGERTVKPAKTTLYLLTCSNTAGSAQASATVAVEDSHPPPQPTVTLSASAYQINAGGSSTLTWSSTNATSCTASGGWSGSEATNGSTTVSPATTTTYTLTCSGEGGSVQASATVTVGSTTVPPGTSWVYYNGVFDWPGDYSFEAVPDYTDTSGHPLSGAYDVKVSLTGAWGGWLPYAQNWNFNSQGYTKLTFALKPTVENQQWTVYFVKVGDIPVGIYLNVLNYGPAPVVGQWNTYTVPLADLGVLGQSIYKFCIQDQTGLSNNVWYVDNVGFAP